MSPEEGTGSRGRRNGRTERAERTRVKLLEAGLELLRSEGTDGLLDTLSSRRVIAQAGSSSGAYYHHFDGVENYLDQLMEFVLESEPVAELAASRESFMAALERGASFVEATLAAGSAALRSSDDDTTLALELQIRANAVRDADAGERVRRMYEIIDRDGIDTYVAFMEATNREPRPPFDIDAIVVALVAVFEGLVLRRSVSADRVRDDLLGQMVMALLALLTRPVDDPRDAGAWLEELSHEFRIDRPG